MCAGLTSLLCDSVHQNGGPGLGNEYEMSGLNSDAEDELNPDAPAPVEELLTEATNDRAEDGTSNGREDDEGDRVLLVISFPHVGNHAQCDGASGR